jgi:hypothetical protein
MSNLLGGWHLTISHVFPLPIGGTIRLQWHLAVQFQSDEAPFVAVGFDTASGNKLNDHHYYYALLFYRKAGKLFRSRYLGANGIVYF